LRSSLCTTYDYYDSHMLIRGVIETERYILATERLIVLYTSPEASMLLSSLIRIEKAVLTIERIQT
jgi:hypothetical protein